VGTSCVRIIELARELQVRPHVILDLLPQLGVHDKKTHSSSIGGDIASDVEYLLRPASDAGSSEPIRRAPKSAQVAGNHSDQRTKPKMISPATPQKRAAQTIGRNAQSLPVSLDPHASARFGSRKATIRVEQAARHRALAQGAGYAGPAEVNTDDAPSEVANYWTGRRLDRSRDFSQIRDNGQFGSYPLHDDCDDESAP
jgi:hypothetical protein